MYEIDHEDILTDWYSTNGITKNLYNRFYYEGQKFMDIKEISDHRKENSAISIQDGYVVSSYGNRILRDTTWGWELDVEWENSTPYWIPLKELKSRNTFELDDYDVTNKISEEPAFKWWVGFTFIKRGIIIPKKKLLADYT